MDKWMDGLVDDGLVNIWMNGCRDVLYGWWITGCVDKWMDGWINEWKVGE